MNHHWANLYAKQRYADLSAEARGSQLLRLAKLEEDDAVSEQRTSLFSRLVARARALTSRKFSQVTGSSGR